MTPTAETSVGSVRYCGRSFSPADMDSIRRLIQDHPQASRKELSRLVCRHLRWITPQDRIKDMSCRVAMLRMQEDGLLALPPARHGNTNHYRSPRLTMASQPQFPIARAAGELCPLRWRVITSSKDASLWNELIHRYHYLGYKTLPGAQIRYLVYSAQEELLAALGFGAAAWKVAPRDQWIGWTPTERSQGLQSIVNNARFLILPWVTSKNLASHILAQVAKRLAKDWLHRYGYAPVLLETFVDQERFRGTCYKAANWIHVGHTQGRGKLDRTHQHPLPVKDIFLYPLQKDFRQALRSPTTKPPS